MTRRSGSIDAGAMRAQTGPPGRPVRHPVALGALKVVHTLVWFSVESAMVYLLYSGVARRSDRRAAMAGAVVAGETLIFLGNGARCPLTDLAVPLGGGRAPVTDVYLPRWFAHNLPAIHAPLILAAAVLHARNLRHRRKVHPTHHRTPALCGPDAGPTSRANG